MKLQVYHLLYINILNNKTTLKKYVVYYLMVQLII
jgi:hypothetical protein